MSQQDLSHRRQRVPLVQPGWACTQEDTRQPPLPGHGVGGRSRVDRVHVEARQRRVAAVDHDRTEGDADALEIGMDLKLAIVPFRTDPDGTEIMTYAFEPVR